MNRCARLLSFVSSLALAGALLVGAPTATADPGQPEAGFGDSGGLVFMEAEDFGGLDFIVDDATVAAGSDRILLSVTTVNGGAVTRCVAATRSAATGAPLTSFDGDGHRFVNDSASPQCAGPVAMDSVNRGFVPHRDSVLLVRRLLASGADDPSYGDDGDTDLALAANRLREVLVAANGVLWLLFEAGDRSTVITFNPVGVNQSAVQLGSDDARPRAMTIAADDGAWVADQLDLTGEPRLWRLLPTGAVDTSFGTNGVIDLDLPSFDGFTESLDVDSQGRVLLMGQDSDGASRIYRLLPDGTQDLTYGGADGVPVPSVNDFNEQSIAMKLDSADRAVVLRQEVNAIGIVRFRTDGALDAAYGNGGRTFLFRNTLQLQPTDFDLIGDDAVVSGYARPQGSFESGDVFLARVDGTTASSPQPPTSGGKPTASIVKPKGKVKQLRGKAGPAGQVRKVELALQRVDKRLLKSKKKCRFAKSTKPAFKVTRAGKKGCLPKKRKEFLKTRGKNSWKVTFNKPLPKGKYRAFVKVTLVDGRVLKRFTTKAGNLRSFRAR